jgi:lipopolysaccharide biosynthesis regulator YciM
MAGKNTPSVVDKAKPTEPFKPEANMTDRNSGTDTETRYPDGTFSQGNLGKRKGRLNRATKASENLLEGSSEALTQKALDLALEGDTTAMKTAAFYDRMENELRKLTT